MTLEMFPPVVCVAHKGWCQCPKCDQGFLTTEKETKNGQK